MLGEVYKALEEKRKHSVIMVYNVIVYPSNRIMTLVSYSVRSRLFLL